MFKSRILWLWSALLLTACSAPLPAPETARGVQAAYYGHALYGDSVFDRDVLGLRNALVARYGRLQDQAMFGQHLPQMTRPSPDGPRAALLRLADGARDGQDVVVVVFSSHGNKRLLAVKDRNSDTIGAVTGTQLRDFLTPLNKDQQVIILQACHSGSLIPALAHPNRIIIAAAAADRTSFGCAPDADNTWFMKALLAELRAGGSWQEVFERTKMRVLAFEAAQGVPTAELSNPQVSVGRNMRDFWSGKP